jgi:hypothetical protein
MSLLRTLASRFILGAALVICLIAGAACAGPQPAPAGADTTASDGAGDAAAGDAAAVLEAYRTFGGDIVALDATTPSTTVDVVDLTGTVPAYSLTGGNPPCSGFIRTAPSLVFTLAEAAAQVDVAFAGNQASNLIVVQEGEEIVCPEVDAATITPEITLEDVKAGRYGVWVGRIDMEKPVDGKLTVTVAE